MKAELKQLIALQQADTNIRRLQADIKAIPERRAEIEKEFDQRAFEIRELEKARDTAMSERARLERELAETRDQAARAERNLMSAKNEHEYTAAIREGDAARKHGSQLETQILEQMESFDKAEAALKEREPEMIKLRAELDERIKAFEEQARVQTEQLAHNRQERERLIATLPKQISTLYNRISTRIRDGIAVAEARNGSCTACFMTLRPQVMSQIRRGDEIIICDNCNRILYYVPADAARESNAASAAASSPEVATP